MIWGAFPVKGQSTFDITEDLQYSEKYISVLEELLLVLVYKARFFGDRFIFQQYNAPIHVSAETRLWLLVYNILVWLD